MESVASAMETWKHGNRPKGPFRSGLILEFLKWEHQFSNIP